MYRVDAFLIEPYSFKNSKAFNIYSSLSPPIAAKGYITYRHKKRLIHSTVYVYNLSSYIAGIVRAKEMIKKQ